MSSIEEQTGTLPLADFANLSSRVSLYKPSSQAAQERAVPLLIILCTWMGAHSKHTAKYTAGYQARFPHAQILLIRTSAIDMVLRTRAGQRASVEPAVVAVKAFLADALADSSLESTVAEVEGTEGQKQAREPRYHVAVHAFSNGGAHAACLLAKVFAAGSGSSLTSPSASSESSSSSVGLPLEVVILDSTPGKVGYSRSVAAMSTAIPRKMSIFVRLIAMAAVRALIAVWVVLGRFGVRNTIDGVRRDLHLLSRGAYGLPTLKKPVPRLYLYSKNDAMVDWRDVNEHIKEARDAGGDVREVVFSSSPHCGHLLEDAEGYWRAVGDIITVK